jgi:hypothetical protein
MPEYTQKELTVFKYLFEIQESGITNMFGAIPYIRRKFNGMDDEECKVMLSRWMTEWEEIKLVINQETVGSSPKKAVPVSVESSTKK